MLLAIQTAALVAAIVFIVATSNGGRLHHFLAVVVASVGYGLVAGMGITYVFDSLRDGFGAGFASIGLLVLAGAIAARVLEGSGALSAIADGICDRIRRRWLKLSTAVLGGCLGVVVSVEAAFLLLSPLVSAVASTAGVATGGLRLLLALALGAGHTLLLPAPGPVIATAVLTANVGLVLLFGVIAAAVAALAALAFVALAGRFLPAGDDPEPSLPLLGPAPSRFRLALPIAVPILLLAVATLGHFPREPFGGGSRSLFLALGSGPAIFVFAVGLAAWMAPDLRRRIVAERGWIAEAMTNAAPLVFVACASVAFARVLQNSGLPDIAAEALSVAAFGAPLATPVILAFAVAAVLKTAQGSSLVAMISAAGIIEPMLANGGEASRALAVVAIGAGAMVVSHANDGFFWVVVRSLKLSPARGYATQTLGTLVTGGSALIAILALSAVANSGMVLPRP